MALLDAPTVREYIPALSGSGEDSQIESFIARFNSLAAGYCGYSSPTVGGNATLEVASYTQYLDGTGTKYLTLPLMPVVAVTTAHVDSDQEYNSDDLVASSDYTLYGDEALVLLKMDSAQAVWDSGKRTIKIVYTAGYSTTPMAIKHACALQVAYWYSARSHIGKSNVNQGGASANVSTLSLLPEVKQALGPFRLASAWLG
jgi:hypothetical protein